MANSKVQKTLNVVAVLRVLIEAVASIVDMFKKKKDGEPAGNEAPAAPNPENGTGETADTSAGAAAACG